MERAVISADGVTKRYGATAALAGATFEVAHGVTGLLGANGAGKTTLLGLVLGLARADSGSLRVLGRDPWRLGPEVRARVGYAPEHEALPPDVAAFDVVRHLAEVHGLPRREATGRASDVLYEVGLAEERFRPVGTMSTGQRQRVKLAAAIVHDPALVLLDEPTNGLDPVQRDAMLGLVRKIAGALGIDVVLSSHLLEEVERVADAVVILDAGTTLAAGSLAELRAERSELDVDLDGDDADAEAVAARLGAVGLALRREGSRLVVAVAGPPGRDPGSAYDAVRDALAATGVGVRRLQRRAASLEEVYLGAEEAAS